MISSVGFYVESLSAFRVVDKLSREGICVLSVSEVEKNVLDLRLPVKDFKKAFAILRGSCYNIKNVRYFGLARLRRVAASAVGLFVGAALFLGIVTFSNTRILKTEVVGNGAYYQREIDAILRDAGCVPFAPLPRDTGMLTAKVLALPRVEFCSFHSAGGILTVEVRCAETAEKLEPEPLLSPVDGVVEELVVVRGTPLVEVGQTVKKGDILVADSMQTGGGLHSSIVIAEAAIVETVTAEYELSEEGALAQALLDYGELMEIHTVKTARGWRVEGVRRTSVRINLD